VNGRIALSWTKSAATITYSVKRSIEGNSFQAITSGLTSSAFLDNSATPGKTYLYKVIAVNSNGESGDSDMASVVLPKASSPLHVVH
jgi:fibronectin type 3 domain-containing protein